MGIHFTTYGRCPDDPPTVLWRVYDEFAPAVTVLAGRLENVSTLMAPHQIEDRLNTLLRTDHPDVWEQVGGIRPAARPPSTPPCGRLYCTTVKKDHTHRVYKPGDVVALTAGDPQDNPETWPFPVWAVLRERTEDEAYRDGICVEIGARRDRDFLHRPEEIRRLRADEIVLGPSTW
jgi:hypothetical protein